MFIYSFNFICKYNLHLKQNNLKTLHDECVMSSSNRVQQLSIIQSRCLDLFARKNADYGDAFAKYGLIGVLMRIEDKIQRCISITKNGVHLVSDEGLRDTLLDLHNYAAMAIMLHDEHSLNA
jgi:hypothetical protein